MRALLLALTLAGCRRPVDPPAPAAPPSAPAGLRFDGLYVAPDAGEPIDTWYHLRFYRDGAVVSASVTENAPQQVAAWLTREDPNRSGGTWTADGQALSFSTTWRDVVVDYQGEVLPDGSLRLRSRSQKTSYEAEYTFTFAPAELPTAPEPLRFDGIYTAYVFLPDGTFDSERYLRFFADGTVYGMTVDGSDPASMFVELTPDNGIAAAGTWREEGARIWLQLARAGVTMDLEGERLVGGTLLLRARVPSTGYEADYSYRFTPQ